jgi:hypothetical protein
MEIPAVVDSHLNLFREIVWYIRGYSPISTPSIKDVALVPLSPGAGGAVFADTRASAK